MRWTTERLIRRNRSARSGGFPKTTLNTVIKQAEADGCLTLTAIPGKRREMSIALTETGKAYAARILGSIYRAEEQAMKETLKRYPAGFVDALDCYAARMKESLADQIDAWESKENQSKENPVAEEES